MPVRHVATFILKNQALAICTSLMAAWYGVCYNQGAMRNARASFRESERGVSLIELLVVLAVAGILVFTGFNVMSSVIPKQRVNSAANDMVSRLRAAKMLSVVHNRPVSVVVDVSSDTYFSCLDGATFGLCTDSGDDYLNLENGRVGTLEQSTFGVHTTVDIYAAYFGGGAYNAVTFLPPAGTPVNIVDAGAFVNGSVCFEVEAGDEDDAFADRYAYRRISITPIVGKMTLWKNRKDIVAQPACGSSDADWERVY